MTVLAGLAVALAAAAKLVEGAGGAVPDFAGLDVQTLLSVRAAAVRHVVAAVKLAGPVAVDGVMVYDYAGQGL